MSGALNLAKMSRMSSTVNLQVRKVEKDALRHKYIFSNICAVSPQDFPPNPQRRYQYILIQNIDGHEFVVTALPTNDFPPGGISLSDPQRAWCSISLSDQFKGQLYDRFTEYPAYASTFDVVASFASQKQGNRTRQPFDEVVLEREARNVLNDHVVAPEQRLLLVINEITILLVVGAISLADLSTEDAWGKMDGDSPCRGIVTQMTNIRFIKDPKDGPEINTARQQGSITSIFQQGLTFEELGIGGLGKEFQTIIRRAFNSRMISIDEAQKLGVKHVKGMLLYGPPGTGKTLIAREIGKILNTREPKVINGPEILNKYVGGSEENVRKIFEDAQKEYGERYDKSDVHLIIFDELDAVCKQRGLGTKGGSGVGDSIVNQLLSILDGVKPLNNILLIGMTNRKDMIDEALLRPGRLEVLLEIPLPDERGRLEILQIHTKTMATNKFLNYDVQLEVIAEKTKNYSGAELFGIVNSARSFAMARHRPVELGQQPKVKENSGSIKLIQDDFIRALKEVKPAYGVAEDEVGRAIEWDVIKFHERIDQILGACRTSIYTVEKDEITKHMSILLHGPPGAGKTALAARVALDSGFPFVQLLSPANLANQVAELAKISYINSVFEKAGRSPLSIVILDDLTRLIEWSKIGPMYSNKILQTIITRISAQPPEGRRLFVIATTSDYQTLQDFGVTDIFRKRIQVDPVQNLDEMGIILKSIQAFDSVIIDKISRTLIDNNTSGKGCLGIGIKYILQHFSEARTSARKNRLQQEVCRAKVREMAGIKPSQQELAQEHRDMNVYEMDERTNIFTNLIVDMMR